MKHLPYPSIAQFQELVQLKDYRPSTQREYIRHLCKLAEHFECDPAKLTESVLELPVQVNGKLRDKITVPAESDEAFILQAALTAEKVRPWLEGKAIKKKLYVAKKLVNIVVA